MSDEITYLSQTWTANICLQMISFDENWGTSALVIFCYRISQFHDNGKSEKY